MTGTTVTIRALAPDEQARYKAVRLAALADTPSAFTATFDGESTAPAEMWTGRVATHAQGDTCIVVADAGLDHFVGLAGGVPISGNRARVVSVWVNPAFRSRGIAAGLIEHVAAWAAAAGYRELQIETALANPGPRALYARLGFADTDEEPEDGCSPTMVRALR